MKHFIFALACLITLSACDQLTAEQWSQLNQTGNLNVGRTALPTPSPGDAIYAQINYRSPTDVQYLVRPRSTASSYSIEVFRANSVATNSIVTLSQSDQPVLFAFLEELLSSRLSITSRSSCTNCTGNNTIALIEADASVHQYRYPLISSQGQSDLLDQLNVYVLNHL